MPTNLPPLIYQPSPHGVHHMIRVLRHQGEGPAGKILAAVRQHSDAIRQLAYRLYTLCERKGWAEDARGYNELVTAWHGIETASQETGLVNVQTTLDI